MTGIRDLSVIETPPLDRQAIRTYVTKLDDNVIREAVLRELRRGGQVFFVHNRVESIERMGEKIRALVPEARVIIGHGQMKAHQLEKVMLDFMEARADILLCTAIIESGLDIPNANTIVINRADTFGLAQLYQLRGRVGRSPARAYAYLLIPGERLLTQEARLRLQVLQELDDLGGGFKIAAHDLEIRGAGNLLGKHQSGHITAVGFELYTQMMEQAVQELRGEPAAGGDRARAAARHRRLHSRCLHRRRESAPDVVQASRGAQACGGQGVDRRGAVRPLRTAARHRGNPDRGDGRAPAPAVAGDLRGQGARRTPRRCASTPPRRSPETRWWASSSPRAGAIP